MQEIIKIDMIYVVHRIWRNNLEITAGSIAQLYDSQQGELHNLGNGYYIKSGLGIYGSGCTFTPGQGGNRPYAPMPKSRFLLVQAHELGHYQLGLGHQNYGLMMGYPYGIMVTGMDARLSPWETRFLGYGSPIEVNYQQTSTYHLNDFASRDNSSTIQVLKVPNNDNDENEFFLLADRSKVSNFDRIMFGDTAKDDPFRNIDIEYGKGIYIYHIKNGFNWTNNNYDLIDQECADGLYDWNFTGNDLPDWADDQPLPVFEISVVNRGNDASYGSLLGADHKSIYLNNTQNWFGIGKKHITIGSEGIDKINTNFTEKWTSRSWKGDRWDAWKKDYNELFSPYSCPSTCNWGHSYSGVYIWINNQEDNGTDFKIYRAPIQGSALELQILSETPPSRPVGLKLSYTECIDDKVFPILTWNQNIEPDMVENGYKRYKIFRATSTANNVPGNYVEIADQYFPAENQEATFTDYNAYLLCETSPAGYKYIIRYKIKAVDNTNWASVFSDFVATPIYLYQKYGSNSLVNNNNLPKEYFLYQNYPNPFNPITNIIFDIPKAGFVTLKIYDILGREINTLVNEFKQAGSYTVQFDGTSLASGVYFYGIQTENFTRIKRCVLIK